MSLSSVLVMGGAYSRRAVLKVRFNRVIDESNDIYMEIRLKTT